MNDTITNEVKQTRYLDPVEGITVTVRYTEDGQPCPYYLPKTPYFKRLAAFETLIAELKECIELAAYLRNIIGDKIPRTVKSSLCFASIVKYAKCFTKAAARATKLDLEQVFNSELAHLKAFHIETIALQERYLASTGKSEFRSGTMVITLDPNLKDRVMISEENAIIAVSYESDRSLDINPDPENYLMLYHRVKEYLQAQKEQFLQTYQVELGKISVSEMYANSMVPDLRKEKDFIYS